MRCNSTKILLTLGIVFNIIYNHAVKLLSSSTILSKLEPRFINKISYQDAYQQLNIWDSMKYSKDSLGNITHVISSEEIPSKEGLKALCYLKNRYFASSNKAYAACKLGFVCVNGIKIYSTRKLKAGDVLTIRLPDENTTTNSSTINPIFIYRLLNFTNSLLDTTNANPPLHIIYEDEQVAVVYKPAGIHSLKWIGTMKKRYFSMDDLLPLILEPPPENYNSLSAITNSNECTYLSRPLPCHRLDARVAGCIIVAKTSEALAHLNKQFQSRLINKEYLAILVGNTTKQMLELTNTNVDGVEKIDDSIFNIKFPINFRNASSTIKIISTTPCNVYGCLTKVSLFPETGRRHQLRQHCALLGTPIVGDDLYHNAAYHKSVEGRLNHIRMLSEDQKAVYDDDNDIDDDEVVVEVNSSYLVMNQTEQQQQYDTNIATNKLQNHHTNQENIPSVRKGIGIFLMAKSIEFEHPNEIYDNTTNNNNNTNNINNSGEFEIYSSYLQNNAHGPQVASNNGYFITKSYSDKQKLIIKVSISEQPKYSQILNKAIKGVTWKENTLK